MFEVEWILELFLHVPHSLHSTLHAILPIIRNGTFHESYRHVALFDRKHKLHTPNFIFHTRLIQKFALQYPFYIIIQQVYVAQGFMDSSSDTE